MDTIPTKCPYCGIGFNVNVTGLGTEKPISVTCPSCTDIFVIKPGGKVYKVMPVQAETKSNWDQPVEKQYEKLLTMEDEKLAKGMRIIL